MTTIQERILEVQRQRAEAERAEQERLRAETDNRTRIAEAEAELAALQKQHAAEQWNQALAINPQLVAANDQAAAAALAKLTEAERLIREARALLDVVETTFQRQQNFIESALAAVIEHVDLPTPPREGNTPEQLRAQDEAVKARRMAFGRLEAQITASAAPAYAHLQRFIAEAPDEARRRARQGIFYAYFEQIVDVPKSYDPLADAANQRRQQLHTRL